MNQQSVFSKTAALIVVGALVAIAGIFYYTSQQPQLIYEKGQENSASSTATSSAPSSTPPKPATPAQNIPSAKTFTDTTFSFEFDYPSSLTIYFPNSSSTKLEPKGGVLYLNTEPPATPAYEHLPFLMVIARPLKSSSSYANGSVTREEITRLIQDFKNDFEVTFKTMKVAGYSIEKSILVSKIDSLPEVKKGQKTFTAFISHNGSLYQFSSIENVKKGVTEEAFDKILSSLAFLK